MATGKRHKAAILARRAAKGPRKKRTRPEPRQYTVADLERARDREAAAKRRIDFKGLRTDFAIHAPIDPMLSIVLYHQFGDARDRRIR